MKLIFEEEGANVTIIGTDKQKLVELLMMGLGVILGPTELVKKSDLERAAMAASASDGKEELEKLAAEPAPPPEPEPPKKNLKEPETEVENDPILDDETEETAAEKTKKLSKAALAFLPKDFEEISNRREIIRVFQSRGVTELEEIIAVCERLKDQVRMFGLLGDIPKAMKLAYEAVQAEDNVS